MKFFGVKYFMRYFKKIQYALRK